MRSPSQRSWPRTLMLAAIFGLAGLARTAAPADAEGVPTFRRAAAGGRATWLGGGEPDLLGDLWVDVPFRIGARTDLFLALDTRTAIERPEEDFAFDVRDLQYDLRLGWRRRPGVGGRPTPSAELAQRGKLAVDAAGGAWVRYLAGGLESPRWRDYAPGSRGGLLDWRIALGPVIEHSEIDAWGVVRGAATLWVAAPALAQAGIGLDLELDGLLGGGRLLADAACGPRLALPVEGGRRASLFLHYLRARNPLGLAEEEEALMLGFAYEQGDPPGDSGAAAPQIEGSLGAGAGSGRLSGQLETLFVSPVFTGDWHVAFLVDANVLGGEDTDELYYLYDLGAARPWLGGTGGFYFHHRSNHRLSDPGDTITSINVLEAGLESEHWNRAGRRASPGRLGVHGFVRAGYLLSSSFGEDPRWHLRGGLRVERGFGAGRPSPYVLVEAEGGDVGSWLAGAGLAVGRRLDVQADVRRDGQYFGADRSAALLTARYGF